MASTNATTAGALFQVTMSAALAERSTLPHADLEAYQEGCFRAHVDGRLQMLSS